MDFSRTACLTIASKNYLALARTVLSSFAEHHPGAQLYLLLVDRIEGYFDPADEPFELLTLDDLTIPGANLFPYQYSILELNTAVKPYALRQLLQRDNIDRILYLDPDIWVHGCFNEVWAALRHSDIVLTPHLLSPYKDAASPSELEILQSGTYNLGYIALRQGEPADQLLAWWEEKNNLECVVDIPRGLFTDQKWMDLVPGYFEHVEILRHPGYNMAYWNLHERQLDQRGDGYTAQGETLVFYHFSGYDPRQPDVLSKHQGRHQFEPNTPLRELFDAYGDALSQHGFFETVSWPYAYGRLDNGMPHTQEVSRVVRRCRERGLVFPDPARQSDAFCQFLMTPNPAVYQENMAPLVASLISARHDVRAAYADADEAAFSERVTQWFVENGAAEAGLQDYLPQYGTCLNAINPVELYIRTYAQVPELQVQISDAFSSSTNLKVYLAWLIQATDRNIEGFTQQGVLRFQRAAQGVQHILNIYFRDRELQEIFTQLHQPHELDAFCDWLHDDGSWHHGCDADMVAFFRFWASTNPGLLSKMNLRYNAVIREDIGSWPSLFRLNELQLYCQKHRYPMSAEELKHWLEHELYRSPLDHLAALYLSHEEFQQQFPDALAAPTQMHDFYALLQQADFYLSQSDAWREALARSVEQFEGLDRMVNLAGYFDSYTGMGESCRSMMRILEAGHLSINAVRLPNASNHFEQLLPDGDALFGIPNWFAGQHIVVANADSTGQVEAFLPLRGLPGRKVGYWVWETSRLPGRWAEHAELYDELWTPSSYSSEAIAATVSRPVTVIPHCIDEHLGSGEIKEADTGDKTIRIGFIFDGKSHQPRKNPEAVIAAFRQLRQRMPNCALVIKSSVSPYNYQLEQLKADTAGEPIQWLCEDLKREQLTAFLQSLDVYVSLHRAEGFGLTLLEAMCMGKPVVATNHSGNMEFMHPGNALLVNSSEYILDHDVGPYARGSRWADPDVSHAADQLLTAITSIDDEKWRLVAEQTRRDYGAASVFASHRETILPASTKPSDSRRIRMVHNGVYELDGEV